MLKRKQATSPVSPAPNKRPNRAKSPIPLGANGQPVEVIPGKAEQLSKEPPVAKQKIGRPHFVVSNLVQADQAAQAQNGLESPRVLNLESPAIQIENISHGQQQVVSNSVEDPDASDSAGPCAFAVTTNLAAPSSPPKENGDTHLKKHQGHVVPNHAGWFSWEKIHTLERRGVPEFFNGKSNMKTPELYLEYRNFIIQKYRENPKRFISLADVQGQMVGDPNAVRHIIEFLDHWGLINYQAPDISKHPIWQGVPPTLEENDLGELQAVPHSISPLESLYQFDAPRASTLKVHFPGNHPLDSVTALAETVASESLASAQGPSVEYHCNSCSGDCSKRRYHCQKQADFDLCPDCYNDGKFGPGMASIDFIRMDALSEAVNSDGGGWTDQETLLLLEALELFGDNWNEIAEHVATKSKAQCIMHFIRMPIEDSFLEEMETVSTVTTAPPPATNSKTAGVHSEESSTPASAEHPGETLKNVAHGHSTPSNVSCRKEDPVGKEIVAASAAAEVLSETNDLIAFADAGNPVMAQVAFLAAMVGPRVAAASAQSALMALSEEDPGAQLAARHTFILEDSFKKTAKNCGSERVDASKLDDKNGHLSEISKGNTSDKPAVSSEVGHELGRSKTEDANCKGANLTEDILSAERVKNVAATALAAAAVKAKLLADQEERDIQRLVASVIENQLKKLEIKLKHFGELELMLKKEGEQVERARQRHYEERARLVASRIGTPPTGPDSRITGPPIPPTGLNIRPMAPPIVGTTNMAGNSTGLPNTVVQRPSVYAFAQNGMAPPGAISTVRPSQIAGQNSYSSGSVVTTN